MVAGHFQSAGLRKGNREWGERLRLRQSLIPTSSENYKRTLSKTSTGIPQKMRRSDGRRPTVAHLI